MDKISKVQGHGVRITLAAVALALTVNAAFGMALSKVHTNGQKFYTALYQGNQKTMYADAGLAQHKICAKV